MTEKRSVSLLYREWCDENGIARLHRKFHGKGMHRHDGDEAEVKTCEENHE